MLSFLKSKSKYNILIKKSITKSMEFNFSIRVIEYGIVVQISDISDNFADCPKNTAQREQWF